MLNSDNNIQYSQCLVRLIVIEHTLHVHMYLYLLIHHTQIKAHTCETYNVRGVQSYLVVR